MSELRPEFEHCRKCGHHASAHGCACGCREFHLVQFNDNEVVRALREEVRNLRAELAATQAAEDNRIALAMEAKDEAEAAGLLARDTALTEVRNAVLAERKGHSHVTALDVMRALHPEGPEYAGKVGE